MPQNRHMIVISKPCGSLSGGKTDVCVYTCIEVDVKIHGLFVVTEINRQKL